jgi:HSP20 family protein
MAFDLPSLRSVFSPSRRSSTDIDNMFDGFFNNFENQFRRSLLSRNEIDFYPLLDVSETDSYYTVDLDIPGVKKEDINVNVDNNILTIRGKKEMDKERKDSNYYSRERFYGDFRRSMALPSGVNTDKIDADFNNGVLTIKMPKDKATSAKTIEIK